jgi:hypothetical protein
VRQELFLKVLGEELPDPWRAWGLGMEGLGEGDVVTFGSEGFDQRPYCDSVGIRGEAKVKQNVPALPAANQKERHKEAQKVTCCHLATKLQSEIYVMLRLVCMSGMYICKSVCVYLMLNKSRNRSQIKTKCKISMLFLYQNFLLFPMVHLFLL